MPERILHSKHLWQLVIFVGIGLRILVRQSVGFGLFDGRECGVGRHRRLAGRGLGGDDTHGRLDLFCYRGQPDRLNVAVRSNAFAGSIQLVKLGCPLSTA